MARYSKAKIAKLLRESDNAPTADAKGAELEELVTYIFTKVAHVTIYGANILDGFRAHELDVSFINDTRYSDLYFLGSAIITECKSTAHPVSSAQVGWFVRKLQDRPVDVGILIALSGITGAADGMSNAHSEIMTAVVRDKLNILVLKREDLLALQTTDDLVRILREKMMRLTMYRTVEI